jgi:hypothetical protein
LLHRRSGGAPVLVSGARFLIGDFFGMRVCSAGFATQSCWPALRGERTSIAIRPAARKKLGEIRRDLQIFHRSGRQRFWLNPIRRRQHKRSPIVASAQFISRVACGKRLGLGINSEKLAAMEQGFVVDFDVVSAQMIDGSIQRVLRVIGQFNGLQSRCNLCIDHLQAQSIADIA